MAWLRWGPEVWAAWVQAVGSVLGIAVAVLVPWYVFRKERNRQEMERAQRAKGYALTLLPFVRKLANKIRQVEYQIAQEDSHLHLDDISKNISIPPELQQQAIIMHELGHSGGLLQDSMRMTVRLVDLIGDHEFYLRYGGEYHNDDTGEIYVLAEPEPLAPVVKKLRKQMSLVISTLEAMFDDGIERS
jgi:hypothetical protein